ncbi:uncharacterized protein LOC143427592 [Xylocopa sonorina]|uniref:uncharacterized protein LOC143427592 n=1 Tax=Xylocopa sonorina TaxID=1818115 RepID=UPI00403B22C0
MAIQALDKDTVKIISTSQIVTSITSATKELIENALDAGCTNIRINLTDNGCTLIEVKDDGCGISKVDAAYMALPSHTSKICSFSDLDSLGTYGFRGEALYALSSVSDLVIITKTEEDEVATSYSIDHSGHVVKSEPCHRSTGTTVQVRDLFKQMPVRRQIITNSRKASQDIKVLESLVKSYGMCKHSVRISYEVDRTIRFAKPASVTFEEAVTYTIGKKITCDMSWINVVDMDVKIKMMIPSKETGNISEIFQSGAQYIFVNNRPVKYKELEKVVTKTILDGLGQESSSRKKPIFVLYIVVNAADIDVNLEPNKTSVLFKNQNLVTQTVEKYLESFYGIQKDIQETNCDLSLAEYQDYTQKSSDVEHEEPVPKKRKLQTEKDVCKSVEQNVNEDKDVVNDLHLVKTNDTEQKEQTEISRDVQNCGDENATKSEKCINDSDIELPCLILSDSDTNDSHSFTLHERSNNASNNPVNNEMKENAEDSPPFELSPKCETLSQLPIVDLGDDFVWDEYSDVDTTEKENKVQNTDLKIPRKEKKSNTKKPATLDEWSKGHVSGLKGGTDVEPYNYSESNESSNMCKGFNKFSKRVRSEVLEKNPTMTAPQVAHTITSLWKKLAPEERGYYRDLARDEQAERDSERQQPEKETIDIDNTRDRLLKSLEKMKTLKLEKKENLVMRTTVPWDVDLAKVTASFQNNPSYKSTNLVVGLLHSNLWVVYKSAHIWILDARNLKRELHIPSTNTNEDDAKNIEQLLNQWFSTKNDLSLLHPIHKL